MSEIKLASSIDESVNFVIPANDGGFFEARYVRRSDEEIICYLSTQTGCNQGCRMCHLTQTKQTSASDAYIEDILIQASKVFDHYNKNCRWANTVNYNFMARGEPLNSKVIKEESEWLLPQLAKLALDNGLIPRFKVSTILPKTLERSLIEIFPVIHPDIYYSAYSADEKVRRKWLPNAMPLEEAIAKLKEWQDFTHKIVRIHYAVIDGVNDKDLDVMFLYNAFSRARLIYDVNLVYYNPYSKNYGKEGKMNLVQSYWEGHGIKTNIVSRVGFDVHASCGMFYA